MDHRNHQLEAILTATGLDETLAGPGDSFISPIELDKRIMSIIGRIVVRQSSIEKDLGKLLGAMLDVGDFAGEAILYANIGLEQKINILQSVLVNCVSDGLVKSEIQHIIDKIKRTSSIRNAVSHQYLSGTPPTEIYRENKKTSGKGAFKRNVIKVELDDLLTCAKELARISGKIKKLLQNKKGEKWLCEHTGTSDPWPGMELT